MKRNKGEDNTDGVRATVHFTVGSHLFVAIVVVV